MWVEDPYLTYLLKGVLEAALGSVIRHQQGRGEVPECNRVGLTPASWEEISEFPVRVLQVRKSLRDLAHY